VDMVVQRRETLWPPLAAPAPRQVCSPPAHIAGMRDAPSSHAWRPRQWHLEARIPRRMRRARGQIVHLRGHRGVACMHGLHACVPAHMPRGSPARVGRLQRGLCRLGCGIPATCCSVAVVRLRHAPVAVASVSDAARPIPIHSALCKWQAAALGLILCREGGPYGSL
jgi:hypothetical protein